MKIINKIKSYLSEILIVLGVGIFTYYVYLGPTRSYNSNYNRFDGLGGELNDHNNIKLLAILLITIGILMIVRKYLSKSNK